MTSCEQVLTGFWDFLDRQMNGEDVSEFKRHLDLCRSCFSRVEFERLLREHMKTKTHHACPEEIKKKIKKLIELY